MAGDHYRPQLAMSVQTARRLAMDNRHDAELTLELLRQLATSAGIDPWPSPTAPPPNVEQ